MRLSHGPSGSRASVLPARFPVGARYVVEGQSGENGQLRVISRYVELPGGHRIKLKADSGQFGRSNDPYQRRQSAARRPRAGAKKIIGRAGTTRQQRN